MRDAQLSERLFVHFVGGLWRAPLGVRPLPAGDAPGRIAAGEAADVARALSLMVGFPSPVALLSAGEVGDEALLLLLSELARQRGVIWKPAPAAARAHRLVQAQAGALGAGLALIQGDHATGQAMAACLPVLWLSPRPAPDAGWLTPKSGATG